MTPMGSGDSVDGDMGEAGSFETRLLEQSINKISELLRVGFGVAGAEIITKNVRLDGTRGDQVFDPLVKGKRTYCIIGFVGIRAFDHVTDKLGGEVLLPSISFFRAVQSFLRFLSVLAFPFAWRRIGDE